MIIKIRSGAFETNSSSQHSICIRNDKNGLCVDRENIVDNILNGRGEWKITGMYFGRSPFRYLSKFSEKVIYALANGINYHDIEDIVKEYVPEFTEFKFINNEYSDGSPVTGYTDDYILSGWLEHHSVSLRDFLTKDSYFVICDGDEYYIYNDMVTSGIISSCINTEEVEVLD